MSKPASALEIPTKQIESTADRNAKAIEYRSPINANEDLKEAALEYHRAPKPGKFDIVPTKPLKTQRDLSLAYSPGVAEPCLEIKRDPALAYTYTNKGNMVACISNGTAVLGLGNIGAQASKPVMEGKSVLFGKLAGVNCIDICLDAEDP